jgi:hypothetical protein
LIDPQLLLGKADTEPGSNLSQLVTARTLEDHVNTSQELFRIGGHSVNLARCTA